MLIQAAISRSREFDADAGGAAIAGSPHGPGQRAAEARSRRRSAFRSTPTRPRRTCSSSSRSRCRLMSLFSTIRRPSTHQALLDRATYAIRWRLLSAAWICGHRSAVCGPTTRIQPLARRLGVSDLMACSCSSISNGGTTVHVDDLDISPSKIGETAQRIVDRAIEEARRREHALLTNEHIFLAFAQVEWDMFARSHARRRAEPAHHPSGDRRAPAHDAVVRRARPPRVAGDQARLQAGAAPRQPRRPPDDRSRRPVLRRVRGNPGRAGVDPPPPRRRAGRARRRG